MTDQRQMLDNSPSRDPKAETRALVRPAVECPDGHVARHLSIRDRNAVVGACVSYCMKDGHKALADQTRLNRVKRMMNFDETLEYYAMIDESLEDEVREWRRAKTEYSAWKDYRAGLVTADGIREKHPNLDLENGPPKPPLIQPKLKPAEMCGPEKAYYFPSKLDVWIQKALEEMEWLADQDEFSVEVCKKFGLSKED